MSEEQVPNKRQLYELTLPGELCYEVQKSSKDKIKKIYAPDLMTFPQLTKYCNDAMKALQQDGSEKSMKTTFLLNELSLNI